MEEKTWIDYVVAIATVCTPILILAFSAIGWKYRQSIERKTRLEDKLRDDRIEIYNQILEPFIIFLMSDAAWSSDPKNKSRDKFKIATSKMLSLEYRKTSFKLSLIGSDSVVRSFSNLMQYFYEQEAHSPASAQNVNEMISLLGKFLLEIRKSMGNESTRIDNWGMIEWFMSDARKYRNNRSMK